MLTPAPPARAAQPTVTSPIQQDVSTSHIELDITTDETTINDDNDNGNVSNPGDDVVTYAMRPDQPQESIPEPNRLTQERQHAPLDGPYDDAQRNVQQPPDSVVSDVSSHLLRCRTDKF